MAGHAAAGAGAATPAPTASATPAPTPTPICAAARTTATARMKALALVALLGSGCSFIFVEGPPEGHRSMEDFHCTSSQVAPMVDALLAGVHALDLSLVG